MSEKPEPGELSIKLKLTNGIELEGKAEDQSSKFWLKSFAQELYNDARKQEEDDLIQGGYKPKQPEAEVKTINR
jgi:hypothetical protein